MTPTQRQSFDLKGLDLISPAAYGERGYPHDAWRLLRREEPVLWYEREVKVPFWALTKHEDIALVSRNPAVFRNAPRLAVFPDFAPPSEGERPTRNLLNMDPPDHGKYRKLLNHRFTPSGLADLAHSVDEIAETLIDEMAGAGESREADFVQALSAPLPLSVLADLLGVPREMWTQMFAWTNQIAGAADPEYRREDTNTGTAEAARVAVFTYFAEMAARCRRHPEPHVVSELANAEVDGQRLGDKELLSYYHLLLVAGNETTRNALTGGLLAFIEHPAQWEKLQADPTLLDSAIEEILRWTSPVIQFCRTPVEDVEIRGRKISAGESLCLFYPSANRDEEIFDDPFTFRIDRRPNRHLAFGFGTHFCLGANLARLEMRAVLKKLLARLETVELAGLPQRLQSSFLGGIKRMPIRYRMKVAGSRT